MWTRLKTIAMFLVCNGEAMMPELHRRGVELVVDLLDAADQVDCMRQEELRSLLRETAQVLGDLLKRDIPEEPEEQPG
jgi:hypothetical protein